MFRIKGSTVTPSTRSPIWNNPDFTINRKPLNFTSWKQKGITHLHHIVQDSKIINFQQLIQKFDISNSQYLQYLQLKSTILPKINNTFNTQDQTIIIDDFSKISSSVKSLSRIYTALNTTDTLIFLPTAKWEQDLSITPNADFWSQICNRTHYTGERLHKMGFTTSDQCTYCTQHTTDNYMHAFWHCTPIRQFWIQVTDHLSHILGCHIPLSPQLCILGDMSSIQLHNHIITTLFTTLAIAMKTILLNWKTRHKLNITHWKNLLIDQNLVSNKTWSTFIQKSTSTNA